MSTVMTGAGECETTPHSRIVSSTWSTVWSYTCQSSNNKNNNNTILYCRIGGDLFLCGIYTYYTQTHTLTHPLEHRVKTCACHTQYEYIFGRRTAPSSFLCSLKLTGRTNRQHTLNAHRIYPDDRVHE